MYRVAAAVVGPDEARDLTQDALLDAWRAFGSLRDRARVRPWLHAIVANRCRKQLRARRSRPQTVSLGTIADAVDRIWSPDISSEVALRDELDRAFLSLSADERIAIVLRYGADLTVPDVARALSIREGTAKSRLHSATAKLRLALEREVPK